jgi:hypothetical protein
MEGEKRKEFVKKKKHVNFYASGSEIKIFIFLTCL